MPNPMIHTRRVERQPFDLAPKICIQVSQSAIEHARPNCPSHCAVANALVAKGYRNPRVGLRGDGTVSFDKLNTRTQQWERWMYRGLPLSVVRSTYLVDLLKKETLKPFRFWLDFGRKHAIVQWIRFRYAGGARRGTRLQSRKDKGIYQGRTMRRQLLQAALESLR